MKSFKGYINESILLNEADTEAAKDMEAVIVSAEEACGVFLVFARNG